MNFLRLIFLFHVLAVVDFVFDAKMLSLGAGFPMFLRDDAVGLGEALRKAVDANGNARAVLAGFARE
ncbi:MAG: hypothetical protein DMG39_00965 [Acidobacteria bacterium]|nr:MAG: hypothetical protein DMG39_00965 [Acidobacteriota bacterium]